MTNANPEPTDLVGWALHYAGLGWAVFPVGREGDLKAPHPSLKSWAKQATADPQEVAALFAGLASPVGIGVHLGRSGLVVLDGDRPEALESAHPGVLSRGAGAWILSGNPERRSYLFRQSDLGEVGQGVHPWGEVKAQVGYVVLPPSPHEVGGEYRWLRRAGVQPGRLLEPIRLALPEAGESNAEKATGAEVIRFMERHQGRLDLGALKTVTARLTVAVATKGSLHATVAGCLAQAMEEAQAGAYPAAEAIETLKALWLGGYTEQDRKARPDSEQEWRRLVPWAIGQALAKTPEQVEERRRMLGLVEVTPDVSQEPDPMPRLPAAFWEAREAHQVIRQAARARLAGPDGVLLGCLVRATTALDHRWVLPPLIQGLGSPNLFGCLVGHSGGGKSGGLVISRELTFTAGILEEVTMGTSGGLVDAFGEKIDGHWEQTSHHLLVTADEVDDFVANLAMGIGTGSAVRTAWTGGALGGTYKGKDSKARVRDLTYRMGVLVGAQPLRVSGLLTGKEREGGTPQRFVWLSALVDDDLTVDTIPDWPGSLEYAPWSPPGRTFTAAGQSRRNVPGTDQVEDHWHVGVPEEVVRLIRVQHLEQARGHRVEGLGHHDNFNRLKIALALALIDRGHEAVWVTMEDWDLAGVVLETSTAVRDWLEAQAAQRTVDDKAEAMTTTSAAEVASVAKVRAVATQILVRLEKAKGGMSQAEVTRAMPGRDRPYQTLAMSHLLSRREVHFDQDRGRWLSGDGG